MFGYICISMHSEWYWVAYLRDYCVYLGDKTIVYLHRWKIQIYAFPNKMDFKCCILKINTWSLYLLSALSFSMCSLHYKQVYIHYTRLKHGNINSNKYDKMWDKRIKVGLGLRMANTQSKYNNEVATMMLASTWRMIKIKPCHVKFLDWQRFARGMLKITHFLVCLTNGKSKLST